MRRGSEPGIGAAMLGTVVMLTLAGCGLFSGEPAVPDAVAGTDMVIGGDGQQAAVAGAAAEPPAGQGAEVTHLENVTGALRVEELEGGMLGVRFSRPVTVLGDVRLVTDVGAFMLKGSKERVALLVFDTSSSTGDFMVKSIFVGVGGAIKDDAGQEVSLSFPTYAVSGDRPTRSSWSERMSQRPRVEFVSAEGFRHDPVRGAYVGSILVVFSEDVRYSTDIELEYGQNPAGESTGSLALHSESVEKMANWTVGVREARFMVVAATDELLWIHGLSYKGSIRDLGGNHAIRSFAPLAVVTGTGEVLSGVLRCIDWLRRAGIGDAAFLEMIWTDSQGLTDEQRVLARERIGDDADALAACVDVWSEQLNERNRNLRNWGYVQCLDGIETAMLQSEALPSLDTGALTDRWLEAKALAYLPYETLTTRERVLLRSLLSSDTCAKFYPQLFYSRWIPESEVDVLDE